MVTISSSIYVKCKNGFFSHFSSTSDRKARVFYASSIFLQALFTYQVRASAAGFEVIDVKVVIDSERINFIVMKRIIKVAIMLRHPRRLYILLIA
jgi:hypothetical protein